MAKRTLPKITQLQELTDRDVARFWSKVQKIGIDECWLWAGAPDKHGYGTIGIGGRMGHEYFAHRIAYLMVHGSIDNSLKVCHACDNPICVNPRHLWQGTQADNLRDMKEKGRRKGKAGAKGEQVGTSKLKEWQIPAIRAASAAGMKQRDIAKLHGVSQTAVWMIISGRYWKHIQEAS